MRAAAWAAIAATALAGGGGRAQDGERQLTGVVAEVRPVEGTIRVKPGDGPDREIVVRSATEITIEGRAATLEEIHPGAEIRASLTEGGDVAPVATRIEVGPGRAAPKADEAPPRAADDAGRRDAREPGAPDH